MRHVVSAKYICRMCGSITTTAWTASEVWEGHEFPHLLLPPTRPPERWEKRPLAPQIVHNCLPHHEGSDPRRGIADLQGVWFRDAPPTNDDGKKP